ncbi:MAG: lysophospholipid acyltransferase family protein [Alistipes sp.]|nr:lysophospholipid acyltransferase family protein [Candidatus Alistipes equi]
MRRVLVGFGVGLLWILCRMVALLPYRIQYGPLTRFVAFLFRDVFRYRRKLILMQLHDSFPEYDQMHILSICNKYYDTLSETVINTLTLAGMSDKERERRVFYHGIGNVREVAKGRDVVVLTSHYGFWEYHIFASLRFSSTHFLAVAYHTIKSKVIDTLYARLRRMDSVGVLRSEEILRFYLNWRSSNQQRNVVLGLIADQNAATNIDNPHWYTFLNHKTLFFEGGERLAMKYHLPVYYVELNRTRAGYYNCFYHLIYDGEEKVDRFQITQRYVTLLENTIRRRPELWMWSHNRWKYKEDPLTGKAYRYDVIRDRR